MTASLFPHLPFYSLPACAVQCLSGRGYKVESNNAKTKTWINTNTKTNKNTNNNKISAKQGYGVSAFPINLYDN